MTDYKTVDVFSAPDDRARREWPYSAVCNGQAFTSWFKIINRQGRFWAYHSICFDV